MYVSVRSKFLISLLVAVSWVSFCVWFSVPWIYDLALYVGLPLAIIIIGLIALLPGFMNSFMTTAFILDKRPPLKPVETWLDVSILVPAYNEQANILNTIESILKQDYQGKIEIIVIDNESEDNTLALLENLEVDNLILLTEKKKGKSHALNTGLAIAKYDHIITLDADTWLMSYTVAELVHCYLSAPPNTAAVAGSVYVRNSRESVMSRIQEWDYFIAIATVKRMQSLFQGTLVAQGALSLYRKKCIEAQGGWPHTVGEDIVLSWGFLSQGYRIDFSERAVSFTSTPVTYKIFFHQRSRWARGMIEAFLAHPGVLFKPKLITFVVYWNLFFPALDTAFAFIFIPSLVAAFFGHYLLAGPMTLAVLPITVLMNIVYFHGQRKVFKKNKLKVRKNISGCIYYVLFYYFLMVPACIHGYVSELILKTKKWGTK